ncbi:O-antigen ligase family protein [Cryobacterium sp. 1639]|uniref:O-antigen ligase family protein n=1 Tax=Cryobacterium inferilacus TaxID=2866629 RepID=UPI001C72B0F7|nr:O-antigen ligase family protein [Cryobacterium sp. 1639]MBX0299894.1 O-antigen ligase family protein [Cryobacterium sp. 1639]
MLAIVLMPFQYALTISIGFPLKISEILLVAAIALYVAGPNKRHIGWDFASWTVTIMAAVLALSSVANFAYTGMLAPLTYDRDLRVDLLLYFGYGLFALGAWAMIRRIDREKTARAIVASIWACGAAVLLQFAAALTGSTAMIAALGFRTLGVTGDVSSLRSGPFLEGQHLGFFAGAALIVAIYRKSWAAVLVALASIVYSQSTTAYIGLAVGVFVVVAFSLTTRVVVWVGLLASAGVLATLTFPAVGGTVGRQLAKLGFTEFAPEYAYATTSLNLRGVKTQVALDMMWDSPVFGVGPGRFGAFFPTYRGNYSLAYAGSDARPIAENAYGHIGAELGVFALAAFIGLILFTLVANRRASALMLILAGYLAVSVSTQSSWTFLPIWVFIGILCAAPPHKDQEGSRERPVEVAAKISGRPRESRNWEPAQARFDRLKKEP